MNRTTIYGCVIGVLTTLLHSCASVSYLDKHGYEVPLLQLEEKVYLNSDNNDRLLQHTRFEFTKNGRVAASVVYNGKGDTIMTTEKKLWFTKQAFPDKAAYYCKTRWKPGKRERISCYTQKQYKQNEAIYYYHNDGRIDKIEDHFSSFYTKKYTYNKSELATITIKDSLKQLVESIDIACLKKDEMGTCVVLEKRYTLSDSVLTIHRIPKYVSN